MKPPFVHGKIAKGKSFIDRKNELKQLANNFNSGTNTIITSPPRWGKTSLVLKTAEHVSRTTPSIRFCQMDLSYVQDKNQFLEIFAREILRSCEDLPLKLSWKAVKHDEEVILNLPEQIARKKKIRFVICLDEFQKIAEMRGIQSFLKKLRSHWQDHTHASYCLCAGRRQVITKLFSAADQPFYGFGDHIYLQKIKSRYWYEHIEERFTASGKIISREIVERILDVTNRHPYHIQQLSLALWKITTKQATHENFNASLDDLLLNNEIMFEKEVENLTPLQFRYLAAIVNRESHLNSMSTILQYNLGSPGNLSTIKAALETKQIVDFYESEPAFINPLFEHWFRNVVSPN